MSPLAGRTIISANLRIFISDSSSNIQTVKTVPDITWVENLVTYNLRPVLGGTVTSFSGGTKGVWKEIPVTTVVADNLGQFMTLGIDSGGSNGLDAYSRENTTNKPELVISYQ